MEHLMELARGLKCSACHNQVRVLIDGHCVECEQTPAMLLSCWGCGKPGDCLFCSWVCAMKWRERNLKEKNA